MRALLDVNVLIALLDADHASHHSARSWFAEHARDSVSVLDPNIVDPSRIHGPRQLTDIYLLALAVSKKACLVTFDQSIALDAVVGARRPHLVTL